jgi:AraC-like DNA-binding protein
LRGDIGEVVVQRQEQTIRLEWQPLMPETGRQRYLSDEMLAASAAIVDSLCVQPIAVLGAQFTYAEPDDTTRLRRVFGEKLSFGQRVSCLYLDRETLNYPMLQQDYQVNRAMPGAFGNLFDGRDPDDRFLACMRARIVQMLPEGAMSIDAVAGLLHVSRRTLQRRLADRGTHFLQVVQEVRSELARGYLGDNRLAISEIAFLLGYSDQGSFSSAFKSWYGVSPSEYRSTGCCLHRFDHLVATPAPLTGRAGTNSQAFGVRSDAGFRSSSYHLWSPDPRSRTFSGSKRHVSGF